MKKKNRGKIAVPIFLRGDFRQLEKKINAAKKQGAEIIEVRADSYPSINKGDLLTIKRILKKAGMPAIFTLRAKEEGGKFSFSGERKLKLIKKAIKLGFGYVDVELCFLEKMKMTAPVLKNGSKTKIILSYHNFKSPFRIKNLREIKRRMLALKPDIMKIAVFSQGEETNRAVLRLIRETKKQGKNIIGIVMGEKGREARKKGFSAGNYLDYFALNKRGRTAPGQLLLDDLKKEKEKDIQKLRKRVDKITEKIIDLISQRKKIVLAIGKIKKEMGMPVLDKERERYVLEKAKSIAEQKGVKPSLVEKILKLLIKDAKDVEKIS